MAPPQLVDGLDHVHRYPYGASLVCDASGDGLPNPPGGVGAELVAAAVVELVHGAHEPQVAFLDQVQQAEAAPQVFLGYAHHQA